MDFATETFSLKGLSIYFSVRQFLDENNIFSNLYLHYAFIQLLAYKM